MSRKGSNRRSISLKGITYQRLKNYCESQGKSISGYLEQVIAQKMDAAGVPVPDAVDPTKKRKPPDEIISQHFTF